MSKNRDKYEALINHGIKNARIGNFDEAKSSFIDAIELNSNKVGEQVSGL